MSSETTTERRTVALPVEARQAPDGTPALVGYAAVFNTPTVIGSFREQIAPGAFTAAVDRDDVRALFNHDPNYVLGRTTAGTLRLSQDEQGLRYEATLPDTQWARDLLTSVQRGDITQSSFGFTVDSDDWTKGGKGELPLRTITAARLWDVSPVTFPAYTQTTVSARASEQAASLQAADTDADLQAATALRRARLARRRYGSRTGI